MNSTKINFYPFIYFKDTLELNQEIELLKLEEDFEVEKHVELKILREPADNHLGLAKVDFINFSKFHTDQADADVHQQYKEELLGTPFFKNLLASLEESESDSNEPDYSTDSDEIEKLTDNDKT